jgi:hypothetical protein
MITAYRMKAGGIGNRMEVQGRFIKLASGGVMAAAVTARRDVMVVCLQEVFKACDALIWTLCHQDVKIVGFLRKV